MPPPEDLLDNGPRGRGNAGRPDRGDRFDRPERSSAGRREGFEDSVWFRLNIGRHQNADPRWILPLLCRRGHVSKNEIGAIRIGPKETMFNIPRAIADRFAEAVQRSANADGEDDSSVAITPAPDGPTYPPRREEAQATARRAARSAVRPAATAASATAPVRAARVDRAAPAATNATSPSPTASAAAPFEIAVIATPAKAGEAIRAALRDSDCFVAFGSSQ